MHRKSLLITGLSFVLLATAVRAVDLTPSPLDRQQQEIRFGYSLTAAVNGQAAALAAFSESDDGSEFVDNGASQQKSPIKAMLLSLAVPGLGQLYNGSKYKAAGFLAVEGTAWILNRKWEGDGDDKTAEYEAFNQTYWSQQRYEDYLEWNYGVRDDDSLRNSGFVEIGHHLPDTRVQQYYEMTGKYDQFAWGWADARLNDSTFDMFSAANPMPRIVSSATTPFSELRLTYETMRDDANKAYDKANHMIIMAMVNRLVAGFEAYIAAKKHNENARDSDFGSAPLKVRPTVYSSYTPFDTPFLKLTYKF